MSARTNLVVNDRAATPVAHTFSPDGDDKNGVHYWSEKTSVPAGNSRYTASLSQKKGGAYEATIKLAVPIVQTQTINGVSSPVVVRTTYITGTFQFSAYSTPQERADAIGQFVNSLATSQTQINDMLVNLSDVY